MLRSGTRVGSAFIRRSPGSIPVGSRTMPLGSRSTPLFRSTLSTLQRGFSGVARTSSGLNNYGSGVLVNQWMSRRAYCGLHNVPVDKLRNIAIIAHVDHGKTTLVDKILVSQVDRY